MHANSRKKDNATHAEKGLKRPEGGGGVYKEKPLWPTAKGAVRCIGGRKTPPCSRGLFLS